MQVYVDHIALNICFEPDYRRDKQTWHEIHHIGRLHLSQKETEY